MAEQRASSLSNAWHVRRRNARGPKQRRAALHPAHLPLEPLLCARQQQRHGRLGGVHVEGANERRASRGRRLTHRLDLHQPAGQQAHGRKTAGGPRPRLCPSPSTGRAAELCLQQAPLASFRGILSTYKARLSFEHPAMLPSIPTLSAWQVRTLGSRGSRKGSAWRPPSRASAAKAASPASRSTGSASSPMARSSACSRPAGRGGGRFVSGCGSPAARRVPRIN